MSLGRRGVLKPVGRDLRFRPDWKGSLCNLTGCVSPTTSTTTPSVETVTVVLETGLEHMVSGTGIYGLTH